MTSLRKNISTAAFAPGNISCFFKVYKHKNPRWMGSYGLGFTVSEGVTVTISRHTKTTVTFNGKQIDFPTVLYVLEKLTKQSIKIGIVSPLPIGSGFGLSGASALATSYALNKLLRLGKTKKQLAVIAHTADVANKTGLGDVVNQYFGGFLLKTNPSSYFRVRKVLKADIPVYWASFSSLATKGVLSNEMLLLAIDKAANTALGRVDAHLKLPKVSFADFIDISYEFVRESGLLTDTKTKQAIQSILKKGDHASMILIGNAVFSSKPFHGSKKLLISGRAASVL